MDEEATAGRRAAPGLTGAIFHSEAQLYFSHHRLRTVPILSVFPALIVHSELKSVHPGFPVAFIF